MGSRIQNSQGLGQTDIAVVFATCLTQSSQNSEVGTLITPFIYRELKHTGSATCPGSVAHK